MEKKITKVERFEALKAILAGEQVEIDTEDMVAFLDHEIELIQKKADRAREAEQKKKEAGDSLRAAIQDCLTTEMQSIDTLVTALKEKTGDISLSPAKIVPRLTQLVKLGLVEKDTMEENDRKIKGYKLV